MPDFVPHTSYGWPEFDELPADVVVADASPQGLHDKLRSAGLARDAFLLGGRRTHGTIRHVYALTGEPRRCRLALGGSGVLSGTSRSS